MLWAGLGATAAAAVPDRHIEGTTADRQAVELRTTNGVVEYARFGIRTAPCSHGKHRFVMSVDVTPGYDASSAHGFADHRTLYLSDDTGDYAIDMRTRGARSGGDRWRGRVSARVTQRIDGRIVAHCVQGRTQWRAARPRADLRTRSDPGDFIGNGGRDHASDRTYDIHDVFARQGLLTLEMQSTDGQDWRVWFSTHSKHRFRRRHYPAAVDALQISGHGRGCDGATGGFRVRRVSYDRHGVITAFTATFVHHCGGGKPALRGRFKYRRGY